MAARAFQRCSPDGCSSRGGGARFEVSRARASFQNASKAPHGVMCEGMIQRGLVAEQGSTWNDYS